MKPEEFQAALARLYSSQADAEEDLGVDQSSISRYSSGKVAVPSWIADRVRQRLAQLEAEAIRRRPGRRPKCAGPPVRGREPSIMELADHVATCPACLARLHCVLGD